MNLGLQEIIIAIGAVISTWIFNNTRLREGVTDCFVSYLGNKNYTAEMHSVLETIKGLQYEAKLEDFENKLKEELYKWYINTTLEGYVQFINDYIQINNKLKLEDLKKETKHLLYSKLSEVRHRVDTSIRMPDQLQSKFDQFRNYLDKQILDVLEKSLSANSRSLLNIQLLDALETNTRWMVFYTTSMFENFNGHFDNLKRKDVFISPTN